MGYQQHLQISGRVKAAINSRVVRKKDDADLMLTFSPMMQSKTHIGSSRRMKNPEKLAASKKKPLVARYILKNRVILTRDPTLVSEYAT